MRCDDLSKEMREQKLPFRCHAFEAACADLDIEHRLTKPRHPWTNGQVKQEAVRLVRERWGYRHNR